MGLSFSVGSTGFLPLAEATVEVVVTVLVRDGTFEEYGGRLETVLKVSARCRPKTEALSSSPARDGRVGFERIVSALPFLMAFLSSSFRFWSSFSMAFFIFLLTMRARRVSTLRRQ